MIFKQNFLPLWPQHLPRKFPGLRGACFPVFMIRSRAISQHSICKIFIQLITNHLILRSTHNILIQTDKTLNIQGFLSWFEIVIQIHIDPIKLTCYWREIWGVTIRKWGIGVHDIIKKTLVIPSTNFTGYLSNSENAVLLRFCIFYSQHKKHKFSSYRYTTLNHIEWSCSLSIPNIKHEYLVFQQLIT